MCRLSGNSGASASWNSKGLSRPVAGKLYLYKSLPSAQILSQIGPVRSLAASCFYTTLSDIILSTSKPSVLSQSHGSPHKTLYAHLTSPTSGTCSADLILFLFTHLNNIRRGITINRQRPKNYFRSKKVYPNVISGFRRDPCNAESFGSLSGERSFTWRSRLLPLLVSPSWVSHLYKAHFLLSPILKPLLFKVSPAPKP
jgi:hypothetical protein